MFLETLLCTRERLVLSYVGRDEVTGEKRPPSSILLELREILASGYLPAPEVEKLFDDASNRPPLRRHRDTQRLEALPLAAAEHAAEQLGESLRQAGAPTRIADLRRTLSPAAFSQVAGRLSLPVASAPAPRELPSKVVVTLADLRAFLEDPLQASARFGLRLREPQGDEELADLEDEPFATEARQRTMRLREAITRAVLASDAVPSAEAVAACYRAISLRAELAGRGPAGLFREAEAGGHVHILNRWRDQLERVADGGLLHGGLLHFGRAAENAHVREILPAIALTIETGKPGRPLRVEIQGTTSVLTQAPGRPRGSLIFVGRGKDGQEAIRRNKDLLPAFLDHVALAAAGLADAAGHRGFLLLSHVDEIVDRRFARLDAARARAYLGRLVGDLMAGTLDSFGKPTGLHAYVLPCEAVFAGRRDGIPITQAAEQVRDKRGETGRGNFSTLYGPIPDAAWRWDPPPTEEAARMAEARFGLFFQLLEAETE
jgi:exodeoxyribonuclease V gamma subunit